MIGAEIWVHMHNAVRALLLTVPNPFSPRRGMPRFPDVPSVTPPPHPVCPETDIPKAIRRLHRAPTDPVRPPAEDTPCDMDIHPRPRKEPKKTVDMVITVVGSPIPV